jgi:hypothetical protein
MIAALAAGCGGGGHSNPDAPPIDTAPDTGTATMDIHGTGTVHNVTDTGVVDAPRDFSQNITFSSFTPTASGFDQQLGTGKADGTFTVPVGLNASTWDLAANFGGVQSTIIAGNSTAPDLSFFNFGRGDVTFPSQSTVVTLNLTGLTAWQDTDDFEIMSSNAGAVLFSPQFLFATLPTAGDTAITAQTVDWSLFGVPLVDASKGDSTVMYQLSTKTTGADSYGALAKLGTTSLTLADGQPATVTLALTAVTQNKTLTTHWKRSQFEALRAQAGPSAADGPQVIAIDALPGATARGFYGSAPDLVEFFPTGTTDIDDTFTYGNPFSTGGTAWDEWAILRYPFNVPVTAQGGATTQFAAGYFADVPVANLVADGNLTPLISGVRNLAINQMDLMSPRTGVGLTPTITWAAPAVGTPTSYIVQLFQVTNVSGATRVKLVASFNTKDTSLQIPQTFLASGASFMIAVTAGLLPAGTDPTTKPFIAGFPDASFVVASAQFTP